ncbi:RDD family protein [Gracilibacillus oryzae]|uniref:RDD family protein n=1 Tax=Gracilibacillus oryzae TaxID=1672701 RepID=A0A7C8GU16_9BACI|nr:RDD family protein [Gracilibacillus oryzae]KAB8137873.1 RDD family protein [Gracilibacillus oryzae]
MKQEMLDVKTPEYVSLQFQIAGLGSRATAFIIDQAILLLTQIIIIITFSLSLQNSLLDMEELLISIILILLFLLNFGYFIILEFFWAGRTIGKRMLGLRVIQENGHRITFLSSLIRNFMRLIDSLPAGYLIGLLLIFLHPKHKRLGDMTAGTLVVHEYQLSKKESRLEKQIHNKGLSKEMLELNSLQLNQFNKKDWELLSAYCQRISDLPIEEKNNLTNQVADILLAKIDLSGQSVSRSKEDQLFLLYLHLKEEWEY